MKFLLLFYLAACTGLTWYSQAGNEPARVFFQCPSYLARPGWSGNVALLSGINTTMGYYGTSPWCNGPASPLGPWNGKLVVIGNGRCKSRGVQFRNGQTSGAALFVATSSFMDESRAMEWDDDSEVYENYPSPVIPTVYCSNQGINSLWNVNQARTQTILSPLFSQFLKTEPNVTVQLEPPSINPFWVNWLTYGSTTQMVYVSIQIIGVVTCVVAMVKLMQFIHFSGRVQFDLPQVSLAICFIGGIFAIMMGEFGLSRINMSTVNVFTMNFFSPFVVEIASTVVILMGLYFGEIASITQAQSVAGLSVYKWPAIVIIAVCWIMIFVSGALGIANREEISGTPLATAVLAMIIVTLGIGLIISIWGGLVLLKASQGKIEVVRVVLITLAAAVLVTGFGTGWAVIHYNIRFLLDDTVTQLSYLSLRLMFSIFIPCITLILVMFNFRVSVSKEIEMSKSGTSSTSSASSGSSSSSSSSASSDPVIEL